MRRILAFAGTSGSGKTTTICSLIRRLRADGRTVAAIKHTHHPVNEERRGDTQRFADSGASPVILAGDGEAVIFADDIRRITFRDPQELLQFATADIVLVEGFKDAGLWPSASTLDEALNLLATIE